MHKRRLINGLSMHESSHMGIFERKANIPKDREQTFEPTNISPATEYKADMVTAPLFLLACFQRR